MDGTRYQDGVLVDEDQLQRTESSKAKQILTSRLDSWEIGVFSGLKATVNSVNQNRVDLSAGSGFAVNGELVTVGVDQLNIPLADTTLGVVNYLYVFYTQVTASPAPHETNGKILNTEDVSTFRVRILTATQFAALAITDPSYLTDAQDRALLCAKITATGGSLTAGSIETPPPWRGLKQASFGAVTLGDGVTIQVVSDDTPEGSNGQLAYAQSPNSLSWAAPGESFGVSVLIPNDGTYTLTSAGGSTIQVVVVIPGLPATSRTVTVFIAGLYTQSINRMSGVDAHHRSLVGSGTPTKQNPHGLSIEDIAPGLSNELQLHEQLMHANGIWRGSSVNTLLLSIDESPNPDRVLVNGPSGGDTYWVNGKRLTSIANNSVTFTDVSTNNKSLYEIYVDEVGNVKKSERSHSPNPAVLGGLENGLVFVSEGIPAGTLTLTWSSFGAGGTLQLNSGHPVTIGSAGLYTLRDGFEYVQYYVGSLFNMPGITPNPPGTFIESITVNAPVSKSQNLLLGQVKFSGSSTGLLGFTPNRGVIAAKLIDGRLFGTIQEFHFRDDTLRQLEQPIDEHFYDGVVIGRPDPVLSRQLGVGSSGGLTVSISGFAPVYVKGRRFQVTGTTLTLPPTSSSVVYVDQNGVINQCLVTVAAFLQGNAFDSANQDGTFVLRGAALALVLTDGGSVVDIIDLRRNLGGGNVSVEPWTVGDLATTNLGGPVVITTFAEFFDLRGALVYASASKQSVIKVIETTIHDQIPITDNLIIDGGVFTYSASLQVSLSSIFEVSAESFSLRGITHNFASVSLSAPLLNLNSPLNSRATIENNLGNFVNPGGGITGCLTWVKVGPGSSATHVKISNLTINNPGGTDPLRPLVELAKDVAVDISDVSLSIGNFSFSNGMVFFSLASGNYQSGVNLSNIHVVQPSNSPTLFGFATGVLVKNLHLCDIVGAVLFYTNVTASDVTAVGCKFINSTVLRSTTNLVLLGCKFGAQIDVTGSIGALVSGCDLGTQCTVGDGQDQRIINCQSSTTTIRQVGGLAGLWIEGCEFSSFTGDPAQSLTDAHFSKNRVGQIVLDSTGGARKNIWVTENSFAGAGLALDLPSPSSTLDFARVNLYVDKNTFIAGVVHTFNCMKVKVLNNSWSACLANLGTNPSTADLPVVSLDGDDSVSRDNIISGNTFDIAGVSGTAPIAGWARFVIRLGLNAIRNQIRGNQFHWLDSGSAPNVLCIFAPGGSELSVQDNTLASEVSTQTIWNTSGSGGNFTAHHLGLISMSDSSAGILRGTEDVIVTGNRHELAFAGTPRWLVADFGVPQVAIGSNNLPNVKNDGSNPAVPRDGALGTFGGWIVNPGGSGGTPTVFQGNV